MDIKKQLKDIELDLLLNEDSDALRKIFELLKHTFNED